MERVSYHRLARRELNEAAQFYNSESPGLGSAFLDEVERCTQAIVDYPEAGSLIIGSVPVKPSKNLTEAGVIASFENLTGDSGTSGCRFSPGLSLGRPGDRRS